MPSRKDRAYRRIAAHTPRTLRRRLDWALRAGAGFSVGFWGGMAALVAWLAWSVRKQK